jgi:hypothetical protein
VFDLNRSPDKGKLTCRSKEGILVGYSEESKAYRIWIVEERKFRQKTMTTMFGKFSKKSKDIDKKLYLLFITDFQPFSVVEDALFKQFVSALNPSYQLPNRHTLSRTTIPALYEETVLKVKDRISQGMKFCITTDCWTSRNTVNYIAVTAHFFSSEFQLCSVLLECCATDFSHTSENLATELRRVPS